MRPFITTFACSAALGLALAAHADTVSNYSVTGTLQTGSLSGTITIDVGPYITNITAVDITADGVVFDASTADASSFNIIDNHPIYQNGDGSGDPYAQVEITNSYESLYLLIAPNGGGYTLCTVNSPCNGGSYTRMTNNLNYGNSAVSGSVAAITPEPSSLILFGTGVLTLSTAARRKLARR